MNAVDSTAGTITRQSSCDSQHDRATDGADHFPGGQVVCVTQRCSVAGDQAPPALAIPAATSSTHTLVLADTTDFPGGQVSREAQWPPAAGDHKQPAPATQLADTISRSPVLATTPDWQQAGAILGLAADLLDDVEQIRKATENRLRQITRVGLDKDGIERGFGIPASHPRVIEIAGMLRRIKHDSNALKDLDFPIRIIKEVDENGKAVGRSCVCMECSAIRNLTQSLRVHPLGPWVQQAVGVGEKQGGRLIAPLRDPYWNDLHDRPRLVSELWSYCGLAPVDGVTRTRKRGELANWNTDAKMRAWLVASKCLETLRAPCVRVEGDDHATHTDGCRCSPYRLVYDQARIKYADAIHQRDCRRCGPAGKPALAGSPLSAGHKMARAVRLVSKEILRDLWAEARRLHGEPDTHASPGP